MKRFAFIYNPAAGYTQSDDRYGILKQKIAAKSNAKIFTSESRNHISDLIRRLSTEYDVFVACGGDGTVREVAKSVINIDAAMGIIPTGKGNDLCKTLNVPTALEDAFELVYSGHLQNIDVGCCNDFIFLNTLGFGFDGLANRYVHEIPNTTYSTWSYMWAALKANIYRQPFHAKINHKNKKKLMMLTLANGRVEGGKFWIAPDASVSDGKLKLVQIRPISKWLLPLLLPFFLIKKIHWIPYISSDSITKLELHIDRKVEIHADGEIIKTGKNNFYISLCNNKLPIICNL